MPLYEHVYLARQDLSAQQVDELTGQFKGVIEQLGGSVQKAEYWGVKSLTYRIRKNRKAHFTLLNIDAPPAALVEIERQERINEDVLRSLTIRVDSLEAGPSAMMRKADRDDRRPLMPLDAQQGHQRKDAALAVIVDAHGDRDVFDRRDDHQRPQDERQDAEHALARDDIARPRRRLQGDAKRIEWARADVAEHDAHAAERERPEGVWCVRLRIDGDAIGDGRF